VKLIDLTGKQFENLVVLYRSEDIIKDDKKRRVKWHCRCNCGNEFDVISDNLKKRPHMTCNECANKRRAENNRIHVIGNKYGKLTILETIPNTTPTKVKCKCDCGNIYIGDQADIVSGHTQSCGCLQRERVTESNTKDWTGAVSKYGVEFLCQDSMNDKGQWLWKCKCGICGNEFTALPAKINNGHITSCGCAVQSAGERYVLSILKELHVNFIEQYSFPNCKYKQSLRFDFAIFNHNQLLYLIEYDGKQHFEPIKWFGGLKGFESTKARDCIKNEFCQKHNIPLLRIPYTLFDEEIKQKIYEYHLSVTTAGCA
jgi:hypothetical protein